MEKQRLKKSWHLNFLRLFFLQIVLMLSFSASAQTSDFQISGVVTDADGQPMVGVTVAAKSAAKGTVGSITDISGKYSLAVPAGATVTYSFVGYMPQTVVANKSGVYNIKMAEESKDLNEVVVIGYGTTTKKDMTGAMSTLKAPELNKGSNILPSDMLVGKVPGLFIVPGDGGPGSGATIRIRGGASLTATNSPMIVIDGLPISNDANVGQSNVLASINPNDIESYTVLKDASATAIYGSRASNGVIIIKTKSGSSSKKLKIDYNSTYSANVNSSQVPVLSASEFRQFMDDFYPVATVQGKAAHKLMDYTYPDGTVGQFNTNWQDQIFQTGLATDQNISISGGGSNYPFRVSLGYTDQTGTLKGSSFKRFTESLTISPKFFTNHLAVTLNVKATQNPNKTVDSGIIGSAATFDPTKPVWAYATSANDSKDVVTIPGKYSGGYFQWMTADGTPNGSQNPLSSLLENYNHNTAYRLMGNIQFDYSLHFLPDLHTFLNLGLDLSTQDGQSGTYPGSYNAFNASTNANLHIGQGTYTVSSGIRRNQLLDFYFKYEKEVKSIASKFDATAGYSWQHFFRNDLSTTYSNATPDYPDPAFLSGGVPSPKEYFLLSLFGRINYTLKDRYLLTATWRRDGSSRFSPQNRWGDFPSVALGWRLSEESFLKGFHNLDNLKLRLSWGQTGQQDIGTDYYPYIPMYNLSTPTSGSLYFFDNNKYQLLSPTAYNENLMWETTTATNAGLDFSFYNSRLNGNIDYFYRLSTYLLNSIPIAAGSNFTNQLTSNIGSMSSKGVEVALNGTPVKMKDFSWDIGVNATWTKARIEKLTAIFNPDYIGVPQGGISTGIGSTIQMHSVGYAPYTFYTFQQVYDEKGFPIQGAFVDQNGDGIIDGKDLVLKHNRQPSVFCGLNMQFQYKSFDLGFNSHGSFDNWVFNDYNSSHSSIDFAFSGGTSLRNISPAVYYKYKFQSNSTQQAMSDLYLENASFWKLDNMTLGYTFPRFFKNKFGGRVSFTAQNILTITKYTGPDPEISSGISNNPWPRPRLYVLGLTLNF